MKIKSKVLIIAGSDSSGGAGIQADIKTVTSLGSYATTAVTAVTAQNTRGVKKIIPIHEKSVQKQMTMILNDIGTHAVKIGMLHNEDIIKSSLGQEICDISGSMSLEILDFGSFCPPRGV